jgi:hypothetical protein
MSSDTKAIKLKIIEAGYKAVNHLVKVAEEDIINTESDNGDVSADKMKNAAAAKKLAIFDAFEILSRIEAEKENLDSADRGISKTDTKQGFAERRSKQ